MSSPLISALLDHVCANCTPVDIEVAFDEMLRETYSFASVGGPFDMMDPATVLREMDPTAYRCGCADWADAEGLVEVRGEQYRPADLEEAKEAFIDEKRDELAKAERAAEDYEAREEANIDEGEAASLRAEVTQLSAEIEELEAYSF